MNRAVTIAFGLCFTLALGLIARGQQISGGGGSTAPGGSTTQYQYNNAGVFAGSSCLVLLAGPALGSACAFEITATTAGFQIATSNTKLAFALNGAGTNYLGFGQSTNDAACLGYSGGFPNGALTCVVTWTDNADQTINSGSLIITNIATDATHTDATVCEDTTTHKLYFGSGTAGICLGTSSLRFKHDVEPLSAGLNEIMRLEPIEYKVNSDHGDPNKTLYGFSAEQGGDVLPELMGKDRDGKPNTFDYLGVVPALVRAVQEQQKQIADLKAELRAR